VRTFEEAEKMVQAGATRIGASAGVKIIQGPSPAPIPTGTAAGTKPKSY
jgi:hypothetical protein